MSIHDLITFITSIDEHLKAFVDANGAWTYVLTAAIVFAETGLVVMPFLPGDSLLFALGAIAATPSANPADGPLLNLWYLLLWLTVAGVLGNTVNYLVGKKIGMAAVRSGRIKFVKQEHLDRTHAFFEKHGGKAVVISRFVPIIRTIAPFVAGAGQMSFFRYQVYNVLGGTLWVFACVIAGYFFGNLPFVKEHFSLVVLGVVVVSLIPVVYGAVQARMQSRRETAPSLRIDQVPVAAPKSAAKTDRPAA